MNVCFAFSCTVETAYSDHSCPGQIDHYTQMVIITTFFLFLMQITIYTKTSTN